MEESLGGSCLGQNSKAIDKEDKQHNDFTLTARIGVSLKKNRGIAKGWGI